MGGRHRPTSLSRSKFFVILSTAVVVVTISLSFSPQDYPFYLE